VPIERVTVGVMSRNKRRHQIGCGLELFKGNDW
jgi:hypothetical protein